MVNLNINKLWTSISFFIISIILLIPLVTFPQDWGGWLFLYLSFLIPLFFSEFRKSKKTYAVFCIILLFYHLTAITNSYIGTTIGAGKDDLAFQFTAELISKGQKPDSISYGVVFYTTALGNLYKVFSPSVLLGGQTSILAYSLSMVFFIKLINILNWQTYKLRLMLLYGLLPANFMFCSIPLREAWEILFFVASIYYGIKLRQKINVLTLIPFLISNILMGLLHKGLIIYNILFLIPYTVLWTSRLDFRLKNLLKKKDFRKKFAILFITVIFFVIGVQFFDQIDSNAFRSVLEGDALEHTAYRRSVKIGYRTDYGGNDIDISSPLGLITTFPPAFFMYMFAPMPWQISSLIDIYALGESFLRLILLIGTINLIRKQKGEMKSQYIYLFICFLVLELLWSAGTKNWGTAIRHRVVAYPIFVLLGGYYFWNIFGYFLPSKKKIYNEGES